MLCYLSAAKTERWVLYVVWLVADSFVGRLRYPSRLDCWAGWSCEGRQGRGIATLYFVGMLYVVPCSGSDIEEIMGICGPKGVDMVALSSYS